MKILILNGSVNGEHGNTNELIMHCRSILENLNVMVEILHLDKFQYNESELIELDIKIKNSHAFLFATGTYWDSWGSPMQKFLEYFTKYEASQSILGKPAGVIVSMHSVGGKEILSRLQGVLNTMGFLIPPMSGFVYSLANHLFSKQIFENEDIPIEDFWSLDDLKIILHNLILMSEHNFKFKTWPIDKGNPSRKWPEA